MSLLVWMDLFMIFLKNNNVVSGFAIMAKTYQDNGNDSVFGKDYLDKSKH